MTPGLHEVKTLIQDELNSGNAISPDTRKLYDLVAALVNEMDMMDRQVVHLRNEVERLRVRVR